MLENTSRRSFVKGAAMGAAALGVAAVAGSTALADEAEDAPAEEPALNTGEVTYADTIAWDGEYDVVVLGFGGSGGFATLAAAKAGANVLAVDAAPKGSEGGDLRVSGEIFLEYDSAEDAYQYITGENQGIEVDEELLRYYCQELTHTSDYLVNAGMPREDIVDAMEVFGNTSTYDLPGIDGRRIYGAHETKYDGYIFKSVEASCAELSDKIDLWLESPAQHLIQAPDTGTILGAEIEHNGETVKIRALNGVILATGGYVNNQEYMQNFLNFPEGVCMGSIYDKGDGIRMALEVSADLWHTNAFDGPTGYYGGANVPTPVGTMQQNSDMFRIDPCLNGSIFAITEGGVRFMDETVRVDHGFMKIGGAWRHTPWSCRNFMVMDAAGYNEIVEDGAFDEWLDQFVSGETIEELAENINVNGDCLNQTVQNWATAIENGYDPIAERDTSTMRAWGDGPYYALQIFPGIHGTRGGVRKTAGAQVMGANGEPIPHLYAAGETSNIYANLRCGGDGISEVIILGTYAGEQAAIVKDALPAYPDGTPVTSDLRFTIGSGQNDLLDVETDVEVSEDQYLGTSPNGNGGRVDLLVTISDGKIDAIEVAYETETPAIGGVAFDTLIDEALAAQSADIDNVTGATFTSTAFKEALEDAMAQAGM